MGVQEGSFLRGFIVLRLIIIVDSLLFFFHPQGYQPTHPTVYHAGSVVLWCQNSYPQASATAGGKIRSVLTAGC